MSSAATSAQQQQPRNTNNQGSLVTRVVPYIRHAKAYLSTVAARHPIASGAVAVIVALSLAASLALLAVYRRKKKIAQFINPNAPKLMEYDYIIVGGGSSGCVIANRLSEDRDVNVLLIEAGDIESSHPHIAIPGAVINLTRTHVDWDFDTPVQPHTNNRVHILPRGKILGGSSCLNWMLYVRGNPEDYNLWADMGCDGWDYKSVLPYFKKSENRCLGQTGEVISKETEYRGNKGPLGVSDLRHTNPSTPVFIKAAVESGLKYNEDYNGEDQLGVGYSQCTIKNGARSDTSTAFVHSAIQQGHTNLTVCIKTHVTRLLFDGNRVIGVGFMGEDSKIEQRVFCRREVILSAGAFSTPQIMMLSGIGPSEELRKYNIPVVADLPVGKNLQDHMSCLLSIKISEPISVKREKLQSITEIARYVIGKNGGLSTQGLEAMVFTNSDINTPFEVKTSNGQIKKHLLPDVQLHYVAGVSMKPEESTKLFGVVYPRADEEYDPEGVSIVSVVLHPKSRGTITLRSLNPLDKPIINPNFFAHPDDVKTAVEGLKLSRKIFLNKHFDKLRVHENIDTTIPHSPESNEYFEEYARRYALHLFHPVGTCKMGRRSDPTTVVDPSLKVHGVIGLRVADASIMPEVISGNTNAPTIMIGEKVSDMIKADWKNTKKIPQALL